MQCNVHSHSESDPMSEIIETLILPRVIQGIKNQNLKSRNEAWIKTRSSFRPTLSRPVHSASRR